MTKKLLLSTLDLEFIYRSLGRNPNRFELKILYELLEPVLNERELLPSRFVKQIGPRSQDIKVEIRDVKDSGEWGGTSYLMRDCALGGIWPSQLSFIWLFHPTKSCLNNIHEIEKTFTGLFSPTITHHVSQNISRKKSGKVIVLAIMNKKRYPKKVSSGQLLGFVKIPKPGKTLMNEKRIMEILNHNDQFISGFSLNGNFGDDLRQLLSIAPEKGSIDIVFPEKYKKGEGLIISEGVSDRELKKQFNEIGYDYQKIGKVKNELFHTLTFGNGQEKKWAVGVTQISIHGNINTPVQSNPGKILNEKGKVKKLSSINIIKEMISNGYTKSSSEYLLSNNSGRNISLANHQQVESSEHPLFDGIRSVADVVRKMAINGSNVKFLNIISNVQDQLYLAGQQSVIHAFGLRNNSHFEISNDLLTDQHQVIGVGDVVEIQKNPVIESDFISLLGSVKGELGHSLFQRMTGIILDNPEPIFDSTMEYNINQALVQAVSTSVVKKVSTISTGGFAMALLNLYLKIENEFGIKIHISRKLSNEELLFGESLGSALVIVGEKELMEFQRICMTHGIPCSTIGRLKARQEITVNDILTIPEKVLKTL